MYSYDTWNIYRYSIYENERFVPDFVLDIVIASLPKCNIIIHPPWEEYSNNDTSTFTFKRCSFWIFSFVTSHVSHSRIMCYVFIVLHLQGSCRLEWIYPPTTVQKSICMYQRMQAYEQCQTAGGNMEGDENFFSYTGNVSNVFFYTKV